MVPATMHEIIVRCDVCGGSGLYPDPLLRALWGGEECDECGGAGYVPVRGVEEWMVEEVAR